MSSGALAQGFKVGSILCVEFITGKNTAGYKGEVRQDTVEETGRHVGDLGCFDNHSVRIVQEAGQVPGKG